MSNDRGQDAVHRAFGKQVILLLLDVVHADGTGWKPITVQGEIGSKSNRENNGG